MTPVSPTTRMPACPMAYSSSVGSDEFLPSVGAAGQPAQHVFGAHDGERKALERAVEGCGDHEPAGPDHVGATAHEQADVGDVLDHFHGQHHIKTFAPRRREPRPL